MFKILSILKSIFFLFIKIIFFIVVGTALLMMMFVISIIMCILYGGYKLANSVLLGTNYVIDGLNLTIQPIVKAGLVFINGIIIGINKMIFGLNETGEFISETIPHVIEKEVITPMETELSNGLSTVTSTFENLGTDIKDDVTAIFPDLYQKAVDWMKSTFKMS